MKQIFALVLCLLIVFSLVTGCSASAKETSAPEESAAPAEPVWSSEEPLRFEAEDGLRATMDEIVMNVSDQSVTMRFLAANETDIALTRLYFDLNFLDKDGEPVREKPLFIVVPFLTDPLQPGEQREAEFTRSFSGAENAVSPVFEGLTADTELETFPWTDPQPDNLLLDFFNSEPLTALYDGMEEELPVSVVYRQAMEEDITVTDPDTIAELISALRNVRIGNETDLMVTDSEFSYTFTLADGSEYIIGFEHKTLFSWHGKIYEVENMSDLLSVSADIRSDHSN